MQVLNQIYADVSGAHARVQYVNISTSLGSVDGGFSPAVNGFADEFHLNALGYCNLFRHTPGLTDALGCTASGSSDPGCTLAPTPAPPTTVDTTTMAATTTAVSLACGVCTYSVCVGGCSSFNQFGHDRFSFPCNNACAHTCNPDAGATSACGSSSSGPDSPAHHGHTDCELYCHTVTDGRPTEPTTIVGMTTSASTTVPPTNPPTDPPTTPTTTPTEAAVYNLRPIGSCLPPNFAFVETAAGCSAAARALGLPDVSATTISTAVSNNRDEVPHGCYFYPANPGDFRLFFNLAGLRNATHDTDRQSVCIGSPSTSAAPTGAPTGTPSTRPTNPPTDPVPPPSSPPPTTVACPRNCGTADRGGGTCRSNGACLSCNEDRLRINGRCASSVSCKGRRVQSGSMTDQGCRCLNAFCHFCTRVVAGDTCRVVSHGLTTHCGCRLFLVSARSS